MGTKNKSPENPKNVSLNKTPMNQFQESRPE